MNSSSNNHILERFDYGSLIDFIQEIGWKLKSSGSDKWLVFIGGGDIEGNELEIILPKEQYKFNISTYVLSALNTLSAVLDKTPDEIILQINLHDRDVLRIRNPETNREDSIPLNFASQQVSELKMLVAYSACSEEIPRPFFVDAQLYSAKKMVEEYRFGHTFRGSFGFTVETPLISRYMFSTQESVLPNLVGDEKKVPLHRKVMERIIRGLLMTKTAINEKNSQFLVDYYKQGFNANMCKAIVNMSMGKQIPIEYSIIWSTKMVPEDESIRSPGIIRIERDSYEYLEFAADLLTRLEPIEIQIKGLVTDLSANDNPLGLDTSRSIIVRWVDEHERKVNKVYVVLNKEDYIRAIEAHRMWLSISISGTLERIKGHWRLLNYHDFSIEQIDWSSNDQR